MKKETSLTTKTPFFNNFEIYRREESPINNMTGNVSHTTPTTPLSANLGRSQYIRSGNGNISSRFQSIAGNHQLYESGGYFPNYYKHQEFYTKHDIDFSNPNSKLLREQHLEQHNQKHHDFHTGTPKSIEFQNHIKSDFHYMKAIELNSKNHPDFHHIKNHNYHHNQNAYYMNHQIASENNSSIPSGPNTQYHNQYYHNEYDATSESIEPSNYYESKQQPHYYENVNYHPITEYAHHPHDSSSAYLAPTSNFQAQNCDNVAFTQYPSYESNASSGLNNTSGNHISSGVVAGSSVPSTGQSTGFISPTHQNSPIHSYVQHGYSLNSNNTAPNHQHAPGAGGPVAGPPPNENNNIVALENSNSSSDFNFLSNLANDFAPEYYQLS